LISQLAKEYEGKVKVLKVDVDKNHALASAAGIRSIPTLFFIDINGNIERTSGGMPYEMLAQKAEALTVR
jgi:thioredoxin 1